MTSERQQFYSRVMQRLWEYERAPEAREWAAWLRSVVWIDPPFDLAEMVTRLEAWPLGKPFPPLPGEPELHAMLEGKPAAGWWVPGSVPGTVNRRLPGTR